MNKRTTVVDIAKRLNVSNTTVISALNNSGRVSESTKKLVRKTAKEMNYKPNKAANSIARKPIRICFIYLSNHPEFHNELVLGAKYANEELIDFNVEGEFHIFNDSAKGLKDFLEKLDSIRNENFQGVITSWRSELDNFVDKIKVLRKIGIPIGTLAADAPANLKSFSVSCSSRVSGKMAAQFLSLITNKGSCIVFTGTMLNSEHNESIQGFKSQAAKTDLFIKAIYENHDNPEIAYQNTEKMLNDYPDIDAVYVGTVNSEAVCRKVTEMGYNGKIKIITSDIYPALIDYINNGTVQATIFQDPFRQGKKAFTTMYRLISEKKLLSNRIIVRPQLVMSSNLENYIFNK